MLTDWTHHAPGWSMSRPSSDGCLALSANVLYYRRGYRPATMLPIDGSIAQDAPPTAVLDWYADRMLAVARYLEGHEDHIPVPFPCWWLRYWHTYTISVRIASIAGAYVADYGNDVFLRTATASVSVPIRGACHGCERPLELLIWLAECSQVAREILNRE